MAWIAGTEETAGPPEPLGENTWALDLAPIGGGTVYFRAESGPADSPETGTFFLHARGGSPDIPLARGVGARVVEGGIGWDVTTEDAILGQSVTVPLVRKWLASRFPGTPPAIVVHFGDPPGRIESRAARLPSGELALLDPTANRVLLFGSSGAFTRSVDLPETGQPRWMGTRGTALFADLWMRYSPGDEMAGADLVRVDPGTGEARIVCRGTRNTAAFELSPSGRWAVWAEGRAPGMGVLRLLATDRAGAEARDLASPSDFPFAQWFPRSDRLLFLDPGPGRMRVLDPGSGAIADGYPEILPAAFFPDERRVALLEIGPGGARVILREIEGSSLQSAWQGTLDYGPMPIAFSPAVRWFQGGRGTSRVFVDLETGEERPGFDLGIARAWRKRSWEDLVTWIEGDQVLYTRARAELFLFDPATGRGRRIFP